MPDPALRCILIGGTSNAGKSTLAASWGAELGWPVMSSDSLGRHPGRPWASGGRDVPPHVGEHYRALSDTELLQSNLEHYRTMWPLLERLVLAHASAPLGRLVLEGSGCLPDEAARLTSPQVGAIWLIADDALIEERIRRESGYAAADSDGRLLIDRFTKRSQMFNAHVTIRVRALGLPSIVVGEGSNVRNLIADCGDRLAATR